MIDQRHIVFHSAPAAPETRRRARPSRTAVAPLIRRPGVAAASAPPVDADAAAFCRGVLRLVGLRPEAYRIEPLVRRLPAALRALKQPTAAAALAAVERDPRLLRTAINTLLIGVTWFYRDARVFRSLMLRLPSLATDRGRPLRVWSAGCSDGSELHTVAMILAETGRLAGARLLGMDCRPQAIQQAAAGCYAPERVEHLPRAWVDRYLTPSGGRWHVRQDLREASRWLVSDLCGEWEAEAPFDLILCRNVTIYLAPEAVAGVWSAIAGRLRPGGLLVVGKAERLPGSAPFERLESCIYRKLEAVE